jgi:hypothetical protein
MQGSECIMLERAPVCLRLSEASQPMIYASNANKNYTVTITRINPNNESIG